MPKSLVILSAWCLTLLATLQAQSLTTLKTCRFQCAEIRATVPSLDKPLTIKLQNTNATTGFILSTDCAKPQDLRPQLCLQLNDQERKRHLHATLPELHDNQPQQLIVRQRGTRLQVIMAGQMVLSTYSALSLKGTLSASTNDRGEPCLTNVKIQKLVPIVLGDDFMRTAEEAKSFGQWQPMQGTWQIHSVMETIKANPAARIRPGRIPVPDRSPNPFTLAGSSPKAPALIVTGYQFWSDYQVAVTTKPHHSTTGLIFDFHNPQNFWSVRWTLTETGTHPSKLKLIQTRNGVDTLRATAIVNARSDNWYRLAVIARDTTITVTIDDMPVLTHRTLQCTGGKVGLLAQGQEETFFDDVSVRSVSDVILQPGEMHADPKFWELSPDPTAPELIARMPQAILTVGDDAWPPQRMTATIKLPQEGALALECGQNQRLQVNLRTVPGKTYLDLRQGKTVLQALTLPYPTSKADLTLDSTQRHVICVYLNGILALRYHDPNLPTLEGSLRVMATTPKVAIRHLACFQHAQHDWERPVDVKKFADDPYMQGWASNRYAWNRTKPKGTFPQTYIFSGDIYGAFILTTPIMHKLDFHFGHDEPEQQPVYALKTRVDEKTKTATVTLEKNNRIMTSQTLTNLTFKVIPGIEIIDEKIGKRPKTPDTPAWGTMTLHRNGYLLWVECEGKTILTAHDPTPARGRTMTAELPQNLDFIQLNLVREKLKDYLFEKAEADWTTTGRWEVTNRFACDPRWSHMNGESFGTAAMWSKFRLRGDFTIEGFAGMRMRQGPLKGNSKMNYPRVGDINVALLADGENLFTGYNLMIQRWDPTWSESTTSFMRLNREIQQYKGELIPSGRKRAPGKRIIPVDYDPGGRAVHGAWYALKIRKTGNRFQAWFDQLKIIDVTDPNPLPELGKLAIWTQNNSIVLARLKVSYRDEDRPSILTQVVEDPLPERLLRQAPAYTSTLLPPLETPPDLPELIPWNGDQSAHVTVLRQNGKPAIALLRNQNAGGDFGVRIHIPPVNQLLQTQALEFDYTCSEQAKINLYIAPNQAKLPQVFIPITGPQHEEPDLKKIASPTVTDRKYGWKHVAIPLAKAFQSNFPWNGNMTADYLMLGMLHEGYLNAGLDGNHKDQWFAIKNLSIRSWTNDAYGKLPDHQRFHLKETERNWNLGPLVFQLRGAQVLQPQLLGNAWLELSHENWKDTDRNTKVKQEKGQYVKIPLNDSNTAVTSEDISITIPQIKLPKHDTLFFRLTMDDPVTGKPFQLQGEKIICRKLDRTPPRPPCINQTITALTSQENPLMDFTPQTRYASDFQCQRIQRENGFPAAKITAIHSGSHMVTTFKLPRIDLLKYPDLFLDLSIPENVYLSASAKTSRGAFFLTFTDPYLGKGNIFKVAPAFTPKADQWKTIKLPLKELAQKLPAKNSWSRTQGTTLHNLALGDYAYSGTFPGASFKVSNLRFAETVAATPQRPLAVSWQAQDLAGIQKYAVKWSPQPDDEPDVAVTQQQARTTVIDLPNGLNFLHVKACDTNGNWSPTTHHPFLVDNACPTVKPEPVRQDPSKPELLVAQFSPDCQGLLMKNAKLTVNGKTARITPYNSTYDDVSKTFTWNLLADYASLNRHIPDQTVMTATLTGAQNAAGTSIPDCNWTWKVDYKQDRKPPFPPSVSAHNLKFYLCFQHYNNTAAAMGKLSREPQQSILVDDITHSPCLQLNAEGGKFYVTLLKGRFSTTHYPVLKLRCRIAPKTQAGLYIQFSGFCHIIPLTGPWARKSSAQLKLKDDNQWHDLTVNLRDIPLPKGKKRIGQLIQSIGIGLKTKVKTPHSLRVDDVALVPVVPPVMPYYFSATDVSGIQAYHALITRTPADLDPKLPQLPHSALTDVPLTEEGLWYLNLNCQDSAGNISETIHLPLWCEAPILPNLKESLPVDAWKLFTQTRKRLPRLTLKKLDASSKKQPRTALQLFMQQGRKTPSLLLTPLPASLANKPPTSLLADLHLHTAPGMKLTLCPVLMNANRDILVQGKEFSLQPGNTWLRNQRFSLPAESLQGKQVPRYIGFLVQFKSRLPAFLTMQNLRWQFADTLPLP